MVTVKHRAGLVAGHLHRYALGDPGVHQVSHRCPTEVMQEHPRHPDLPTRGLPCSPEVLNSFPLEAAHQVGKNPGNDPPHLLGKSVYALPLVSQAVLHLVQVAASSHLIVQAEVLD